MDGPVNTCERCAELHRKLERIREILAGNGDARTGRKPPEYLSPHGKLIAATASAKGKRLSEISRSIGYGGDHVAKVCRGDIALSRRLAILIGVALGIDLVPYVGAGVPTGEQQELPGAVANGFAMREIPR